MIQNYSFESDEPIQYIIGYRINNHCRYLRPISINLTIFYQYPETDKLNTVTEYENNKKTHCFTEYIPSVFTEYP